MSKELESLENIKNLILPVLEDDDWRITRRLFEDYLDIIETALKRLEELEKELCVVKTMEDLTIEAIKDKKLKALEIIKEKMVDCGFLYEEWEEENYEYALGNYNLNYDTSLTQEEYDLLKEVLL